MEEGVDELRRLDEEAREFVLHRGIDELVFVGRDFEILLELRGDEHISMENNSRTHLEQVLLVIERLLFLISQFRQGVVEAVVVN